MGDGGGGRGKDGVVLRIPYGCPHPPIHPELVNRVQTAVVPQKQQHTKVSLIALIVSGSREAGGVLRAAFRTVQHNIGGWRGKGGRDKTKRVPRCAQIYKVLWLY